MGAAGSPGCGSARGRGVVVRAGGLGGGGERSPVARASVRPPRAGVRPPARPVPGRVRRPGLPALRPRLRPRGPAGPRIPAAQRSLHALLPLARGPGGAVGGWGGACQASLLGKPRQVASGETEARH